MMPRGITELRTEWLSLMTSERAATPEAAQALRELIAEAEPHDLRVRVGLNAPVQIIRDADSGDRCLIEGMVKLLDSALCTGPVLMHPTVAAIYDANATVAMLQNGLVKHDTSADWTTVDLISRVLIDVYRAPLANHPPARDITAPKWARVERAFPELHRELESAFKTYQSTFRQANNLRRLARHKRTSAGRTQVSC